mmetsp:Transcript_26339/g.26776  ORF Transcript_26339/g.26776 Transcript_26339/m.26776 type:complete len:215 (-) Transcript_26339:155-799(-)
MPCHAMPCHALSKESLLLLRLMVLHQWRVVSFFDRFFLSSTGFLQFGLALVATQRRVPKPQEEDDANLVGVVSDFVLVGIVKEENLSCFPPMPLVGHADLAVVLAAAARRVGNDQPEMGRPSKIGGPAMGFDAGLGFQPAKDDFATPGLGEGDRIGNTIFQQFLGKGSIGIVVAVVCGTRSKQDVFRPFSSRRNHAVVISTGAPVSRSHRGPIG